MTRSVRGKFEGYGRMTDFLEQIDKIISALQKVLGGIATLWAWCEMHPGLVLVMVTLAALYLGLYWFAFGRPAMVVKHFYEAVDRRDFTAAWELLHIDYQKTRWGGRSQFEAGFRTTTSHTEIKCESSSRSWNPWKILLHAGEGSLTVDATFVGTDRFTAQDILQPAQQYDTWWLRIKNNTEFESLRSGTYRSAEATTDPTLELTRTFKKRFSLQKSGRFKFVIARIDSLEEGIRRSL